jgi:hypothetical protein
MKKDNLKPRQWNDLEPNEQNKLCKQWAAHLEAGKPTEATVSLWCAINGLQSKKAQEAILKHLTNDSIRQLIAYDYDKADNTTDQSALYKEANKRCDLNGGEI